MAEGGDAGGDVVWLTYVELAERLEITTASAQRRVNRSSWARRPGNDGKARIGVPLDVLPAVGATSSPHRQHAPPTSGGDTVELWARIKHLEDALQAERKGRADDREGWTEERVAAAERHGRQTAELRERAARAETERDTLSGRVQAAEESRRALETAYDRWTAGSPLQRALRAFMWRRG